MTARDRGLLPVPDGIDANLRDFLTGVRRLLLDVQAGRLAAGTAAATAPASGDTGTPGTPGPPGPPGPPAPGVEPDLTPPPTPDNLAAVGAFSHVLVTWDAPVYSQGRGNKQTLIYAKKWPIGDPAPTFSEDALQGAAPGALTIYSLPSDTNTRWAIWAKFETNDGVLSVSPAGGAGGVVATTGQDISTLLQVLTGQITESQLFNTLGSRIDLIDGNGAGSVNARISVVQAQVNNDIGLTLWRYWGFDTSLESWAATNATATRLGSIVTWTPTGADPQFALTLATADRFAGATYYGVRARVRRVSGTGAWEGRLHYSTAGHGFTTGFYQAVGARDAPGDWNILEWDMRSLTVGADDWTASTIHGLRIDLVSDAASSWEIDWVAVGSPSTTPLTAAIAEEAAVRADETGALSAQYTVKVDVNGYVSGFGLASSANNSVPTSSFIVRADSFSVASPSGPGIAPVVPFIVRTTPTTENGVNIPPGVYMDAAFIVNLQAKYATISNLVSDQISTATITADQITGGAMRVGATIQSTNYVANTAGWKISANGSAEFGFTSIRGTLTAAQIGAGSITADKIDSRDLTIKDSDGIIIFGASQGLNVNLLTGSSVSTYNWEDNKVGDWVSYAGSGGLSVGITTSAGAAGRRVLEIGDNSGNDMAWLIHSKNVPFNPNALYRMRVIARRFAGAGTAYFGIAGVASDGTTLVNISGANSHSSQHYLVAANDPLTTGWVEYVGYFKGTAATGTGTERPSAGSPGQLHTSTRFIRPLILANYNGVAGEMHISQVIIEIVSGALGTIDQLNAGNVSTWIAAAAIGDAYISNLNADKLTAGSIRGRNVQAAAFMTKGTFLTGAPAAGATTVLVDDTSDFPSSGTAYIIDSTNDRDAFTYTGKTSNSFTGCAGVLGSHTVGATVVPRLKNMLIDNRTNEMRFYGNRGDGTVEELAAVGEVEKSLFGFTYNAIAAFGSSNYNGQPVYALNNSVTGTAAFLNIGSGDGVTASVEAGTAVVGLNQSASSSIRGANTGAGPSLQGDGSGGTGYGASLVGNATRGPLFLGPIYTSQPSNRTRGQLAFITNPNTGGTYLCTPNGSTWIRVADGAAWNAAAAPGDPGGA